MGLRVEPCVALYAVVRTVRAVTFTDTVYALSGTLLACTALVCGRACVRSARRVLDRAGPRRLHASASRAIARVIARCA